MSTSENQTLNDLPMVRSFKPMLEMLRDRIGSTKVIKFPANTRSRFVSDRTQSQSFRSNRAPQFSNLVRGRGSFASMGSIASQPTEYSLVQSTAAGASATIYKGYQDGGLSCVAVKRIDASRFSGHEEELKQMLEREIMALDELSKCAYITKFFEYVEYEERQEHWMVMEYCDGGSAIDLLKLKLPLSQVAAIVAAVLRALEFVHERGYIHGDIKAANILLASPGVVKVCDFGLASKVKDVDDPDYHALGTVDYMSPEVMTRSLAIDNEDPDHESYEYDRKIDIWAVGIVALELLIGHPPMHHYRHYEEDEFSQYISELPNENRRQSAFFDLFFYAEGIHELVAEKCVSRRRNVPDRDIVKLVSRFPELEAAERDNNLQRLLHKMSLWPGDTDVTSMKNLFSFNPAQVVGGSQAQTMYAMCKCLSFVSLCLMIKKDKRPDAKDIAMHPFVRSQYKEYVRLEPDVAEIMERNKHRSTRKQLWKDFKAGITIREINKILKDKADREKTNLRRRR